MSDSHLSMSGSHLSMSGSVSDASDSLRLLQFGFAERINFDARQELQKTRSRHFRVPDKPEDPDIWKRPPPDFRPQAWAPRPPKRNTRDSVQPWRYSLPSDQYYETKAKEAANSVGPGLMKSKQQQQQQRMLTVFRLMRPETARRRFVQEGTNKTEPYQMPQPHDFRQYPPLKSLGLPEFTTGAEKDPYNTRFLTQQKDTIVGPLHEIRNMRDASGTLWSAVRHPPKWEPRLHLPQEKFPNRPCEYSRYRQRDRDPFVAFMDSVESTLERRWQAEKLTACQE